MNSKIERKKEKNLNNKKAVNKKSKNRYAACLSSIK